MSSPATEVLQQGLEPALPNDIEWPQGDLWSDEPPLDAYSICTQHF